MTEDEFIECLNKYYSGVNPHSDDLDAWTKWICEEANNSLFRQVIVRQEYRQTEEAIRKIWRKENSPLANALK